MLESEHFLRSGDPPEQQPCLSIHGLYARAGARTILDGIDAVIPANSLCAIMGSSGSGKTSLIKVLAGVPSGLAVEGRVRVSLPPLGGAVPANLVGYMPQSEDLLPLLTVRETLHFAAALRRGQRRGQASADELLTSLCLQDCADTQVGSISGGEKRRVSLATRLLEAVNLFCADEPTSGLDSRSAVLVVELLRAVARGGRTTVLCSIHQPRREIFELFGQLLLLSEGRVVYAGPAAEAVRHVQGCCGLELPAGMNAADFLIDSCSLDRTSPENLLASSSRLERLAAGWRDLAAAAASANSRCGSDLLQQRPRRGACSLAEIGTLTHRAWLCTRRDRLLALAVLMQNSIIGLVFGLIYWQLSTDTLPEIHSRLSLVYITPGLTGIFVTSASLYILSEQMKIFDAERCRDHLYSSPALVISIFASSLPLHLVAPLPMFFLLYFMANLRTDVLSAPLVFFSLLVLVRVHATALSLLGIVALPKRSFAITSVLINALLLICVFTGGFFTPIASLSPYISWLRWIAYTYYGFRLNAAAQFSDFHMGIGFSGNVVLAQLGFERNDFLRPLLGIGSLILAWLLLSVLALSTQTPRQAAVGHSVPEEAEEVQSSSASPGRSPAGQRGPAGASVLLDHVSLELLPQRCLWYGQEPGGKKILDGVSASFHPGQLTAIMGPSGAGKTSLLSVLAGRVGGKVARLSGDVLLAGQPALQPDLRRCVALVGQEDHHLPGLSVQETLQFYARLRLPFESQEERSQRLNSLVSALGLRGCLLTRVGTPATGGISGGERRRVSVLMGCLGDPAVLLLDEPTTGLDALASQQLVQLLQRLVAERAQTVACTLHQPRADVLRFLDRILLMGPGGRLLLEGSPLELEKKLLMQGISVPTKANIADFVLDHVGDQSAAERLWAAWKEEHAASAALPRDQASSHSHGSRTTMQMCPWRKAFRVLFARSLLNFARQPGMIWARCAQVIIYAIVLVPMYAPLGHSQASVTSRVGLLYQSLGLLFGGTVNNLAVFPIERDVLLRESADGLYSVGPFFATYTLFEAALALLSTSFAGVVIVQAIGLLGGTVPQATFVAVLFASLFNGETIGIVLNSVVLHAGFSVNMINGLCVVLQVMAGFLANVIPRPLQLLNRLSPQMYACRALAVSQFPEDEIFDCDGPSPICLKNGSDVLAMLGLSDAGSLGANLTALFFCCVIYRGLSFLVLKFRVGKQSRL